MGISLPNEQRVLHKEKTITKNGMPRIKSEDLRTIVKRRGYGVSDALRSRSASAQTGCKRPERDVEPDPSNELEGPKKLQIGCSGKVTIRLRFYRHRLADYSRAISEKALIDALQYCGAICGDSEKDIRLIDEGQFKVESKDEERTELTLEYPEVDFDNLFVESTRKDGR